MSTIHIQSMPGFTTFSRVDRGSEPVPGMHEGCKPYSSCKVAPAVTTVFDIALTPDSQVEKNEYRESKPASTLQFVCPKPPREGSLKKRQIGTPPPKPSSWSGDEDEEDESGDAENEDLYLSGFEEDDEDEFDDSASVPGSDDGVFEIQD